VQRTTTCAATRPCDFLVEDEPFVREATCGILQSAGFRVLQAADASDALSIYIYEERTRRIDLVMTDMGLPAGQDCNWGKICANIPQRSWCW
jgi:DNA-binding response OmpR family regulator